MTETVAPSDTDTVNIGTLLDTWVECKPHEIALAQGDVEYTWTELRDRVRRNAAAQLASGLTVGDHLVFFDKNHAGCIQTTLASAVVGTINTVINFRLAPAEIEYIIKDARAKIVLVGHEFADVMAELAPRLPSVERVIVVGGEADEFEAWLETDAEPVPVAFDPDRCFLQLYTSGTTGHPKGAMLTHRSLGAHNRAAVAGFGFDSESVNMVAMPLFHVGGSSWTLAGMSVGASTAVVREVVPAAVLDEIVDRKATHAFFVPAVYGFFLQLPDVAERDYSALRCLGYGGSPMPLPLMRRCLETWPGIGFYQVYGMTEMSGVFSVLAPEDHLDPKHPERLVSAGHPLPGVTVKVSGPDGAELPLGEVGEFWTRSEQHMVGYWDRPEATAEVLVGDDWLRTGDAGSMDEGGYLFIQDRVKDMIISGGENVYPAEVERVLVEHPAVAEVSVIGIPDDKWGESVKAVIVIADGAELTEPEVISYARERLAGYKTPKSVDFLTALPRNSTGKVLKREIRKPYWEGRTLHD